MANNPATADVAVTNFPTVQAVSGVVTTSGTVTIDGQPIDVDVLTLPSITGTVVVSGQPLDVSEDVPVSGDIMFGSRTTTGTLFTVPAGRVWRGSISLAATVSVAGNAGCSVSAATGGTLHQLPLSGLALTVAASANTLDNVYIHGGAGGNAVTFTAGAAGTTAGSATGRLL